MSLIFQSEPNPLPILIPSSLGVNRMKVLPYSFRASIFSRIRYGPSGFSNYRSVFELFLRVIQLGRAFLQS